MKKTKKTDEISVETKDMRDTLLGRNVNSSLKQKRPRRMPTKAAKAAKDQNKMRRTRMRCRPGRPCRSEYNTRLHTWCDTCETVRCTRHWSGWSTTCACRCRARTSISTLRLLLSTRTWGTRSLIKRFNYRTLQLFNSNVIRVTKGLILNITRQLIDQSSIAMFGTKLHFAQQMLLIAIKWAVI